MKPSTHRYVLPPVLLGIHVVLLLPLILSPTIVLRPPHLPGHSWPSHYDRISNLKLQLARLYPQYSIPLGVTGIVGVWISKQLAGKIPLPKDERRKRLAMVIEWSVLFGMGVMEEVWRWGLVRLLVRLEGGHGGFRGGGVGEHEGGVGRDGMESGGVWMEGVSLWEGVYMLGWIWSAIECLYSWYGVRPVICNTRPHPQNSSSPKRPQIHFRHNSEVPHLSAHRPLLAKRARSESVAGANEQDLKETRALFGTFSRKKRDIPTTKSREIEDRTVQFLDNNTTAAESESSRTAYDESIRPAYSSLYKPKNIDTDLETGLLSRLREIRREQAEEQADSDNGYGDDEESVSSGSRDSLDSARFEAVTPLLSSSMPYDDDHAGQLHPHHEEQALLQNQRRQMEYNTIADPLPLEPADDNEDEIVTVHECDPENGEYSEPAAASTQRSPIDRVYPSYPSYSATYNHSHFSNTVAGPSSAAIPTTTRPAPTKRKSTSNTMKAQHCSENRRVYGANVNTLSPYLPVLWRLAALLRHISHALIYAWAPALVFKGRFQWVTFLVVVFLAGKKGWSTVEWFGGGVSRTGLMKASIVSLVLAGFLYLVSLSVWGIIP